MSLITTIVYKTDTNKEPFTEWFLDLDTGTRAIVSARLKRLKLGNFGNCKPLKNASGVCELVIDYGPGYRIFFGKDTNVIVVLLFGGDKGSQDKDIARAKKYWLDYKESEK